MLRLAERSLVGVAAQAAVVLALGAACGACSAIVSPDTSRLGPGSDLDGGGVDGGGGRDGGGDPDATPVCAGGCDDGVTCTVDRCGAVGCEHAPDDAACGDGMRCSPVMGCVALRCTSDAECDDGRLCTGAERCDPGASSDPSGCVAGTPLECDDGVACTNDLCVDATGGCIFMPSDAACDDAIACTSDACAPAAAGHGADGCVHVGDDALCDDGFCFVGGRCDPVLGCTGATPRTCPDDGNRCTAESCDATAGACVSTPITGCTTTTPGDLCAAAIPLPIDATSMRGSTTGTLGGYADDYAFCGSSGGRDVVYYFDLTSTSDVVIDTSGSPTDTVLAVGFDCAAAPLVCNDDRDPGAGTTSRVFLHRVGPPFGASSLRVYVYVDGYDASATGAFTLNVAIQRAHPDSCTEPMDITGGGTVLGVGPIAGASGGPYGSCQSFSDRSDAEGVFRMRPPGDRAHNQIDVYSATFNPEIYIRTGCSGGFELDCDVGRPSGGVNAARISTGTVPSDSTQYLFADGMSGVSPGGMPHGYIVVYDP